MAQFVRTMAKTILHLGSNIGLRNANLRRAQRLLEKKLGKAIRVSSCYETGAWGIEDQRDFLNIALCFKTKLSPDQVLDVAQRVESKMGRRRLQKWGERIIDVDIIFYKDEVVKTERLQVPHPWMQERRFVLVPVAEIAANWRHPVLGLKVKKLLRKCADSGKVHRVSGKFQR